MTETKTCPCCKRHCDLKEPQCERGREYLRTGTVEEHGRPGKSKPKNIQRTEAYEAMDIDNKLILNLRDLGYMIRFLFEGKGSQKRILIILNEAESMTQRELTERLGVQPGSASEVIGKLEHAGLIVRTPSKEDRRTADISLTAEGRALAEEAMEKRRKRHQEMFSGLSEEEKNTLLALTEKLNREWERTYGEREMKGHGKHEGCGKPGGCTGRRGHGPHESHGGEEESHGHRGHGPHENHGGEEEGHSHRGYGSHESHGGEEEGHGHRGHGPHGGHRGHTHMADRDI